MKRILCQYKYTWYIQCTSNEMINVSITYYNFIRHKLFVLPHSEKQNETNVTKWKGFFETKIFWTRFELIFFKFRMTVETL